MEKEQGKIEFLTNKKWSIKDFLKPENFIIPMSSQWKTIFDTSILIVIGYSCLTTVYVISFDIEQTPTFKIIDNIVMGFFALDFVFNFFQEYQDKEKQVGVKDHK